MANDLIQLRKISHLSLHIEMKLNKNIGKERAVHGRRWHTLHGGYFSDPMIARPLIQAAIGILAEFPADVIIDLGGGTGFLLSQLRLHYARSDTLLVNIDCSEDQIVLSDKGDTTSLCTGIDSFKRGDVASRGSRVFFIMRSVLHYFGEDGSQPLLRHLRSQAEPGEFFVHQTASFDNEEEAVCLNALYRHMRIHKWYPTVNDLRKRLLDAGWLVRDTAFAPSLRLTSDDLGLRYELDANDIARIRKMMWEEFGKTRGVFKLMPGGFRAKLHYRIYSCVAVP
jgi:hypothetical protein